MGKKLVISDSEDEVPRIVEASEPKEVNEPSAEVLATPEKKEEEKVFEPEEVSTPEV
jgi:hypothetical protein